MLTSVLVLISHSSTTTTTQSSWFPECSATISIESEGARHIDHLDRHVQQSCQLIYPKRSSLRDVWLTRLIVDQLMKNDGFPTFPNKFGCSAKFVTTTKCGISNSLMTIRKTSPNSCKETVIMECLWKWYWRNCYQLYLSIITRSTDQLAKNLSKTEWRELWRQQPSAKQSSP